MKKILILLLLLIISNISLAGTMRHDVQEQEYIEFGDKFYCVKKIVGIKDHKDYKTHTIGSCVVLNSHWVITCAHISEDIDYLYIVIDNENYVLDKLIVNQKYDKEKMQGDIALGFCQKGFGKVVETSIYNKKIAINDNCSFAGYGKHGNMLQGANKYDGRLRAGTNRINSFLNIDLVLINASKDFTKTQLEFLPNVGDSGGGLFIEGKLAGITSLVLSNNKSVDSIYEDEGAFVEIYPYLEWINNNVKKK